MMEEKRGINSIILPCQKSVFLMLQFQLVIAVLQNSMLFHAVLHWTALLCQGRCGRQLLCSPFSTPK
jgi:hypothetical protein